MKKQLNEVTGKNRYCGPTAIATILGITTDEAARIAREISGKTSIRGMRHALMLDVLKHLGCTVEYFRIEEKMTANQWVQSNKALFKNNYVILSHGKHYGTMLGRNFLCSLSYREVVGLKEIPKLKSRVKAYFVIKALPDKVNLHGSIKKKPVPAYVPAQTGHFEYGICNFLDDPESTWPPRKMLKLTAEEYAGLERALQWPEDLVEYDRMIALNGGNALTGACA